MTEDAAPYRALLDALGYPPIAGGAPEGDDPAPEDTPNPDPGNEATPPEGTPAAPETPETDWQSRYADLQPEYTRATQEAARYRQVFEAAQQGDPEAQAALIAAAGYELPKDTGNDDDLTDEERLAQRLEKVEQTLTERDEAVRRQQEEQDTEQAWQNFYESEFKKLDPEEKLDQDERSLIVGAAHQLPPADDGLPDLVAGKKAIDDRFEARFKERVQSKRTPQAPSGASPSHQPDLDDPEQRRDYLARAAAELETPGI